MWESICLTLAATAGNNIGKVLQKKGTVILPPLSLKLKVIRAYAVNKSWAIGFLIDISGALLMLRALSMAPVSVVQPVSGCGLAILSIFSHFYLQEVMNVIDWMGITLAGIGTIVTPFGQTRGLKHGRAIVISTCAAVASIVTGILAGMLALRERLPSPVSRLSLLLGWLFIMMGVLLLVSSTRLMRHLPWPLQNLIPCGMDRNFCLRRTGSHRVKDPSPAAVIPAATLHHLISAPAKAKA
ncbi:probable magnesium transporter NIPA9 [Hibiscus syriacus]|uniref:probable magnesium transporter NIPA9 n=1 Tax=Hibiscus syriacus TaxID=106335 RepID=UPI001921D221|nr:probable magnesium transporter NIPA9 [Hibiscus syriacus]